MASFQAPPEPQGYAARREPSYVETPTKETTTTHGGSTAKKTKEKKKKKKESNMMPVFLK